mmetsp:Transcript_38073/g.80625  ORF Transcript_38073/g.80625 Transcript_38073/m.80625 type:complete len:94 (-) Transcript_38073:51-332(-)
MVSLPLMPRTHDLPLSLSLSLALHLSLGCGNRSLSQICSFTSCLRACRACFAHQDASCNPPRSLKKGRQIDLFCPVGFVKLAAGCVLSALVAV